MEQLGWHPNEIATVKSKCMPHMATCILHTPPPCAYWTRRRQQRELETQWEGARNWWHRKGVLSAFLGQQI